MPTQLKNCSNNCGFLFYFHFALDIYLLNRI